MGAPKTLPLDYFDKQSSSDSEPAPKTLPLDYFDKQDPAATAPKDSFTSGFLQQSGAEPSLKEQKESTEGFYHSLFTNPRATLKETGAAGFDQLIQFSQDVHEHLTGKPELEGMVAAAPHFKKGEYAKGVAAYLSKVIPFGFGAPFGAAAEGRPKEAAGRVASEAIQLATMRGGPVESVENMAEGVVGGPLREISGTGPAATEEAAASAAKDAQEAQGAHAARVADVTDANRSELARSRQAHEERVSDIEGENARTQAAHQEAVSRIRQANTEAQAAVRGGQAAEQTATKLADTVSEALPAIADAETAKAKAAYPKIDATMSSDTLYGGLQDIVDETLKGSGNVPMSITRILKDVSSSDTGASGFGRSTGPTVGGRHFNLNDQGDLKAYQNMKSRGVFTEDEIARMEGHLEGKPISFDDLHGMYSELGRELYRGDLPGDAKAALSRSRGYILERMTQMAKDDSPGTLAQFRSAQRGWQVLENTFRNTKSARLGGSPIAQALKARDPITGKLRPAYVRAILTDSKAYTVARDLLKNYPESGAELSKSLELLKRNTAIAKSSPKVARLKSEPIAPQSKPLPSQASISLRKTPEPPQIEPFDATKWREQKMADWASKQRFSAQSLRPWRLPYDIVNRVAAWLLKHPEFRRRIAAKGATPALPAK